MKKMIVLLAATLVLCGSAFAKGEPFIGELTAPDSGVSFQVQTLLSGTDRAPESTFQWGKPYTFEVTKIYEGGVDLVVSFAQECFLDHIDVEMAGFCEGATLQLFVGGQAVTPETPLVRGVNSLVPAIHGDRITLRFRKAVGYVDTPSLQTIKVEYKNYKLTGLHFYGATGLDQALFPLPQQLSYGEGFLESPTGLTAPKNECAADNFTEKYAGRFGKKLARKGNISFKLDKALAKEAFTIDVSPSAAQVRGGSSRALLYASEKLLQLCDGKGRIRCASIKDEPAYPFRGIRIILPKREHMDFVRRMVRYVWMPLGYNTVFLEIQGTMEFKRHPEINKANCSKPAQVISQEEVRELCDYMRRYGLDVIPLLQSFGHVRFVTKAHPEIGEQAEVKIEKANLLEADQRSHAEGFHTACPNHPDYFPLFFDLWDEVIAAVKPDGYVNIGHDEIYELGRCPLCKAEGGANVYAREVTTMHDYLAKKGYGVMMWSDMITEKRYASTAAIDKIPKDIICLPFTWYFHLAEEGDSEQPLVDHGFRYMIGNFYSSHFQDYAKKRENPGFLGGQNSVWSHNTEEIYGSQGKMYDFAYCAQMLWNRCYRDDLRRTFNELVLPLLPGMREDLHYDRRLRETPVQEFTPSGADVPYDITNRFRSAAAAGEGSDAVIPLGVKADRFHIVHATDAPAVEGILKRAFVAAELGRYTLEYEDGTSKSEPIWYAYHVGPYRWCFGAPLRSSVFRHYGYFFTYPSQGVSFKTWDGRDATAWDYALDNPEPGKTVKALRISFKSSLGARLLVFSVRAANLD